MSWLEMVAETWLQTLLWVSALAVVFAVLVRLSPCNPGMYWWKDLKAAVTDSLYWFVVPLFLRNLRNALFVFALTLFWGDREPDFLPVQHWPLWQQAIAILILQDVMLYFIHRVFHQRWAWKVHAVHHAPTTVDWMTMVRFHPINHLLEFGLADAAILVLGFSPTALFALTPINVLYSAMVHANLNWTFGPLRYIFASPVFHRWHHTTEKDAIDKNFASTFPLLDVLFGTFYMPPGKLPEHFGDADFPTDLFGQLLYPFWRKTPAPQAAPPLVRKKAAA